MPRRWQYPSWALVDTKQLTLPEVTTPDKWWQPFSEPVRQHAGKLAFAAIIASGVAPIDSDALTRPEVTSLDKWHQPLSEPVRVDKPLPVASYPSSWVDADLLTQPEATSLDKWFAPLSEPTLPVPGIEQALISSGGIFFTDEQDLDISAEELSWYKNLGGIGVKKELRLSGPTSFPVPEISVEVEDITLDKWYSPLTEPVLVKPRASDFPAHTNDTEGLTQPEVTSLDKWWRELSEPVRAKKPLGVASYPSFFYEGEPTEVDPVAEQLAWFVSLSEPTLPKVRVAEFPSLSIDSDALTRPEETTLDRWWQPLSEFLHKDKRSAAALEPASVIDPDLLTRPEETLVSKWVPQTNEPVRVKKGLLTALQEAYFPDTDLADIPPAEEITLDKWYHPFSEPVLVKARASEFPTSTNDTEGLTQPEVTSLDKWFSALSEPVRVQPRSLAGLLAGGIFQGDPTDTVEPLPELMGWFKGLDEPVLPITLPIANYPATFFENEVSELDPSAERLAWYVDLSTPTLPKVRVAEFPAFVTDGENLTRPETTTLDRWWRELSEPVRTQPISLAALISGEVQVGEPSDLDPVAEQLAWYRNLDLPTLPKPRVAEFLPFIIDVEALTLPEVTTLDKWWQPASEPVRVKARFLEALQLHVITDITFDIAEIITLDKWYMPLVEPVRLGDRLIVPFRLPASVGREYQVATLLIKGRISKEADQTHVSKEADQTHISKEADQTKDSKRC